VSSTGDGADRAAGASSRPASGPDAVPANMAGLAAAVHELELEEHHRPPPAGPISNLVTAVVIAALAVGAIVGSLALGVGSPGQPGPGTWPLLMGVALLVLSVVLAFLARRTTDAERFTRASWQVLAGLVTMILFVSAIGVIGFEIPAALLTFVWLRYLGGESWRLSIVISIAVVVAFYAIFVGALSVRIPHLF
jgi:Tripartite tricarboxylate transporter TctB family